MSKIWKVRAKAVTREGTTTVEGNTRIYRPGKIEWITLKEFTDYWKAEQWLTDYIHKTGYYYGDFKVTK
jgi:hypothetical protein